MVLEAVMLCVDNSEWMRNGDYSPSRWESQSEAAQYIATSKINGNAETTVGLLSMARNRIDVHLSPQRTSGAVMSALASSVKLGGKMNLLAALKTAQLALKNRPNKNQRQRIIVFVGSPIDADASELEKVGKLFKKNNIAVDVVNFGTENASNDNAEKLETLINAVNASDNSHLLNIPPGPHVLADLILTSPIINDGGSGVAMAGVGAGVGGGAGLGDLGGAGVDPNLDPEMALALRMSMEEERARQQRAAGGGATTAGAEASAAAGGATASTTTPPSTTDNNTGSAAPAAASDSAMEEDDEATLLARAIAMSMEANAMQTESVPTNSSAATTTAPSSNPSSAAASSSSSSAPVADADISNAMNDPDFLNSLLSSVTGDSGDMNDLLDQLTGDKKTDEKKKDSDKK